MNYDGGLFVCWNRLKNVIKTVHIEFTMLMEWRCHTVYGVNYDGIISLIGERVEPCGNDSSLR